jgi:biotin transport system substrate-specific component
MEGILTKEFIVSKRLCKSLGVAAFIILTALSAFVRIPLPFTPVPLTLQTFFVLLSGAFLGAGFGALSQLGYIFLGLSGLSVFTSTGSGLLYLSGPTGGYLAGFVLASFFLGKSLKFSRNKFLATFILFCAADIVLLSTGTLWLHFISAQSLSKVILIGFLPFIPGDLLKAWLATALYLKLSPRLREVFGAGI